LNGALVDSILYFPDSNQTVPFSFPATGDYYLDVHLVNECGDSVDYYIHRDFHVVIVPILMLILLAQLLLVTIARVIP